MVLNFDIFPSFSEYIINYFVILYHIYDFEEILLDILKSIINQSLLKKIKNRKYPVSSQEPDVFYQTLKILKLRISRQTKDEKSKAIIKQ